MVIVVQERIWPYAAIQCSGISIQVRPDQRQQLPKARKHSKIIQSDNCDISCAISSLSLVKISRYRRRWQYCFMYHLNGVERVDRQLLYLPLPTVDEYLHVQRYPDSFLTIHHI